jgi:hypothetical protein
MLIQKIVLHDSIVASQRLVVEFCNRIGMSAAEAGVVGGFAIDPDVG